MQQRAVAIALAGGLLAASAGAFALAQVLKLERSPIEAIRVDPTPNHGRGKLDLHDSALFSPRCATYAVPSTVILNSAEFGQNASANICCCNDASVLKEMV